MAALRETTSGQLQLLEWTRELALRCGTPISGELPVLTKDVSM
jgi:hypothetical protein